MLYLDAHATPRDPDAARTDPLLDLGGTFEPVQTRRASAAAAASRRESSAVPSLTRTASGAGAAGRRPAAICPPAPPAGVPAAGKRRRSRSISPRPPNDAASQTLSDAVDRQDSRDSKKPRRPKADKGKGKGKKHVQKSPSKLMDEIGCSCLQCRSASSVLSRSYSRGLGSESTEAIQLDQKSWLECFDRKHRYGANLRPYYQEWQVRGTPGKHFWAWLDADPKPEVPEVPRTKLDSEVVTYLDTDEARAEFRVQMVDGVMLTSDGSILNTGKAADGNEWIFVVSARDRIMYTHRKETKSIPRFHHTSFLGAEPVRVAGQLEVIDGQLKSINLHSGHYRPREDRDLLAFLRELEASGIDLAHLRVDVQRLVKKARDGGRELPKVHKKHNRQMWKGIRARWFLEHKVASARVFEDIRRLRRIVDRLLAENDPQPVVPSVVLGQLRNRRASSSPDGFLSPGARGESAIARFGFQLLNARRAAITRTASGSGAVPGASSGSSLPRTSSGGGYRPAAGLGRTRSESCAPPAPRAVPAPLSTGACANIRAARQKSGGGTRARGRERPTRCAPAVLKGRRRTPALSNIAKCVQCEGFSL